MPQTGRCRGGCRWEKMTIRKVPQGGSQSKPRALKESRHPCLTSWFVGVPTKIVDGGGHKRSCRRRRKFWDGQNGGL